MGWQNKRQELGGVQQRRGSGKGRLRAVQGVQGEKIATQKEGDTVARAALVTTE
jgi:hypothetical protein